MFRKNKVIIYHNKGVKPLLAGMIVFVLAGFLLILGFCSEGIKKTSALIFRGDITHTAIIEQILPVNNVSGRQEFAWVALTRDFLFSITGLDPRDPGAILGGELNWTPDKFAGPDVALAAATGAAAGEEDFYLPGQEEALDDWVSATEEEFGPVQLNGDPMILIYTTHNAESYRPSDGAAKLEGKNAGVAAVAATLSKTIESKHAIKTLYSDVIHDYPDFTKSYINSMQTVKSLLQANKKIQMVIDVHRDAGLDNRSDTLVKIGNKNYAKVMIVVGKEHPRWQENLAFASKLEMTANKLYPGLIKSVRLLEDRRYNQHLHPRALLFEFGSDLNTREDATNSAVLMAQVIAETLKN